MGCLANYINECFGFVREKAGIPRKNLRVQRMTLISAQIGFQRINFLYGRPPSNFPAPILQHLPFSLAVSLSSPNPTTPDILWQSHFRITNQAQPCSQNFHTLARSGEISERFDRWCDFHDSVNVTLIEKVELHCQRGSSERRMILALLRGFIAANSVVHLRATPVCRHPRTRTKDTRGHHPPPTRHNFLPRQEMYRIKFFFLSPKLAIFRLLG